MAEQQQDIRSVPCWHEQSKETIIATLNTTELGLSEEESQGRLKIYGFNRLPEPKRTNTFFRFLLQFHNILIYVLSGLGSNGTANRLKDYIGLLISIIRYVSFYRIVNCEVVQVFSLNTDR